MSSKWTAHLAFSFFISFFLVMGDMMGLISWSPQAFAATPLGQSVSEKQLASQLKLYQSISTLEAPFKQIKTLKEMGVVLKSEGRFKLIRPNTIIWEIIKPSLVKVTLTSSQIEIKTGSGPESKVQTLKMSEASSDQGAQSLAGLVGWLRMDAQALSRAYSVYSLDEHHYRFEPKSATPGAFRELKMFMGDAGQLKQLFISESSGDTLEIDFGKPVIHFDKGH